MLSLLKLVPLLFYRTHVRAVIINHPDGYRINMGYEFHKEPTLLAEIIGFMCMLGMIYTAYLFGIAMGLK